MVKKSNDVESGKVAAIVSYFSLLGWIVALILNNDKKSLFAKFHLRQALLLNIVGFVSGLLFWIPIVGWALGLGLFVLWIIGLLGAINGEEKSVPYLGDKAQEWFKGL